MGDNDALLLSFWTSWQFCGWLWRATGSGSHRYPESGFLMQETSLDLDVSKVGKISTKLKNHGAPDGLCTQCQVTFIRIVCPPTGKAKKMVASAFVVFLFLELL